MSQDNYILKDVAGYEGLYAITNDGRVWSYPKEWVSSRVKLSHNGKWLKVSFNPLGYPQVHLTKNGKRDNYSIHRLVALTHIPNPLSLPEVNHIDGNKLNNNIDNLEWCTSSYNIKHAIRNGLRSVARGEMQKNHKLTDDMVKEIRRLYKGQNITQGVLARKYGVSRRLIGFVVNYQIWQHVA